MQSMTGFGSVGQETGTFRVAVRLRSVNHRHLDLVLRMPEEFRPLEIEIRERIGKRFRRGRIELRVDVDDRRDRPMAVVVNNSWIAAILQASRELDETDLELEKLRLGDLLRIPDAVRISSLSAEADEESSASIYTALELALNELEESRQREGRKLLGVLEDQLATLASLVEEISGAQESIRSDQADRLRRRIRELVGSDATMDEGRIEQEIAILAERSDVREELDRLDSHIGHFRDTMSQSGPAGKKLDFIAQEIARELTTLGAKCRQAGVMQHNVDARLVCEQIREQVQNVE